MSSARPLCLYGMVIVAGHITVDPEQRESYLAGCAGIVEQGRRAAGCLDFAITADLVDPGRVDVFERWESQAAVEAFRGDDGPSDEQGAAIRSASVGRVRRRRRASPVRVMPRARQPRARVLRSG